MRCNECGRTLFSCRCPDGPENPLLDDPTDGRVVHMKLTDSESSLIVRLRSLVEQRRVPDNIAAKLVNLICADLGSDYGHWLLNRGYLLDQRESEARRG
jgi:hypothetical protein